MNPAVILSRLRAQVPKLLVVYAFGSRIQGTAGADSDLDLAVLVAGYAEPLLLWELAGELADPSGCLVDLLDLRAASTVMQYRIIIQGKRWWAQDAQAREGGMADDILINKAATIEKTTNHANQRESDSR